MGMEWVRDCFGTVYSRWLVTSIACCSSLPVADEGTPKEVQRPTISCHDQPQLTPPPQYIFQEPRFSLGSRHASSRLSDSRSFASRASARASLTVRRHESRRPTISSPSDFRRVEHPSRRSEGFRPLHLSIHIPGNELPQLPVFSEDNDSIGLAIPAQALNKSKSDPILSRPSTSFTIPRKPVGSPRTLSVDESRYSFESRLALTNGSTSQLVYRRPSFAASQSTQDFIDSLDARLPQPPPAARTRAGSEPVVLHRRASDQNVRLRTHLEEREEMERRLIEHDTILEDQQLDVEHPAINISNSLEDILNSIRSRKISPRRISRSMTSPQFSATAIPGFLTSASPPILRPSPLSSTQVHSPQIHHQICDEKQPPPITDAEHHAGDRTSKSTRSRISQWLLRSASASIHSASSSLSSIKATTTVSVAPSTSHQQQHQSQTFFKDRSSTGSSSASETTDGAGGSSPWTSPGSEPRKHRKDSESVSSCFSDLPLEKRGRFDTEKKQPVIITRSVGVAF